MTEDIVRVAGPEDEDEIMNLLYLMHAEGGLVPLDEMRARAMFHRAFARRGAVIGVVGHSGDIRAMIMLMISQFWYSAHFHLEELFNFVRPDCRKGDYARRMIDFAKKCASETGMPLTIGVLTNQRMEGKVRFYRRYLGNPAGAWFVYGGAWKHDNVEEINEDFWRRPFPRRLKEELVDG